MKIIEEFMISPKSEDIEALRECMKYLYDEFGIAPNENCSSFIFQNTIKQLQNNIYNKTYYCGCPEYYYIEYGKANSKTKDWKPINNKVRERLHYINYRGGEDDGKKVNFVNLKKTAIQDFEKPVMEKFIYLNDCIMSGKKIFI